MLKDSFSVASALETIVQQFDDCPDLIQQSVSIDPKQTAYVVYFNGFGDVASWSPELIRQVLAVPFTKSGECAPFFGHKTMNIQSCAEYDGLISALAAGETVFLSTSLPYGITVKFKGAFPGSETPFTDERSIYGTNVRLHEQLSANLALLRHKMLAPHLKFKMFELTGPIRQSVVVAYLKGLADPDLFTRLCQKIETFSKQACPDLSQLGPALKDFPHSPFPQYQVTQQTAQVVAALQEGRMAVLREGTPIAFIAPANFFAFFRSPDDRQTHWLLASSLRLFRIAATLAAILLPALYIAFTSYHYQYLSQDILIPLAHTRSKVPFIPVAEVLIMELALTVFFELGQRLLSPVGILIGVMAGLSLAVALLTTGMIGNVLIVISFLSLLVAFLQPVYHQETLRLLRWFFILFASLFGILGVAIASSFTFCHLLVLQTLGKPYLEPLVPFTLREALVAIIHAPHQLFRRKSTLK